MRGRPPLEERVFSPELYARVVEKIATEIKHQRPAAPVAIVRAVLRAAVTYEDVLSATRKILEELFTARERKKISEFLSDRTGQIFANLWFEVLLMLNSRRRDAIRNRAAPIQLLQSVFKR